MDPRFSLTVTQFRQFWCLHLPLDIPIQPRVVIDCKTAEDVIQVFKSRLHCHRGAHIAAFH